MVEVIDFDGVEVQIDKLIDDPYEKEKQWLISPPHRDLRFWGTLQQARAKARELASEFSAAELATEDLSEE